MFPSMANMSCQGRLIAEIVAASSYQNDGRPMPHAEITNATNETAAGASRDRISAADFTG